MNAINKEKIFEVLRNYHTHRFPAKIKDERVNDLRNEFGVMEDRIVGMILSLVNGKAEFIDSADELNQFKNRLEKLGLADAGHDASRKLLAAKIDQLNDLLVMAKESDFKLRRVRAAKAA